MIFFSFISSFSFSIYLILGLYVLVIDRKSPLHRNFFYFSLTFALWALFAFLLSFGKSETLIKLEYSAALTYEIFLLRFFILLTAKEKAPTLKRKVIFLLLWVIPLVFQYQNFAHNSIDNSFPDGFWYVGLHVMVNSYNFTSIALLILWAYRVRTRRVISQVRIITISGVITIIIGIIADFISGFNNIPTPTPAIILIFIFSIFYVIIKYRMIEISPLTVTREILNSIDEQIILFDNDGILKWTNETEDLFIQKAVRSYATMSGIFKNNISSTALLSDLINNRKSVIALRHPVQAGKDYIVYDTVIKRVFDGFGKSMGYLMKAKRVQTMSFLKKIYGITKREYEIIQLLISGMTYTDISRELHISENTLKTHITSCYGKMGINNKVGLINIINNIEK